MSRLAGDVGSTYWSSKLELYVEIIHDLCNVTILLLAPSHLENDFVFNLLRSV